MYFKELSNNGNWINYFYRNSLGMWYDINMISLDDCNKWSLDKQCLFVGKNTNQAKFLENIYKKFIDSNINVYTDGDIKWYIFETKDEYKKDFFVEMMKIPR